MGRLLGILLVLLMVSVPMLFVACGGGGGNDDGPSGGDSLSAETVEETVVVLADTIPGCVESTGGATVATLSAAPALSAATLDVLASLVEARKWTAENRVAPLAVLPNYSYEDEILGDCGGRMNISSVHASGTTTISLAFDNFCSELLGEGDAALVNGSGTIRDVGTPTENGPSTSKLTLPSANLSLSYGGDSQTLKVTNAVYAFGNPGVEPGSPTVANPDRLTLQSLEYKVGGETALLQNVDLTTWESSAGTVVAVASGRYTSGGSTLDLSTPEGQPLVIDGSGDVVSGSMVVDAGEGSFTLSPSGVGNIMEVEFEGETLDTTLDCSGIPFFGDLL